MAIRYENPPRVEYEGAVLSKRENWNYRVMSDVWATAYYATVWDEAAGKPREVMYALNFEGARDNGEAEVDATDEVKAKVEAYRDGAGRGIAFANAEEGEREAIRKAAKAEEKRIREAAIAEKRAKIERNAPKVGDVVEVKKGNEATPKGERGTVFWAGWSKRHDASWRVGFKTKYGDTHWIAASGVKVVERAPDGGGGGGGGGGKAEPDGPVDPDYSPEEGDKVEVARGNGAGAVGRVMWVGSDKFTGAPRVGVRDAHGHVVWTAAANTRRAA